MQGAPAGIVATVVIVAAIWWARAVFVPILFAVLVSHALEPIVAWLERRRCPRPLGVVLIIAGLLAGLSVSAYALRDPATAFMTQLPASARKLRQALEARTHDGAIRSVQQVATDLERAAGAAGQQQPPSGVTRVRIEEPPFRIGDLAWRGSRELLGLATQCVVVICLVYYLLLAGDLYRRKLAIIAGPSFSRRRIVLEVLTDIDRQLRRFLLVRLLISVVVAVATYVALRLLDVSQPGMWALVTGGLNVVPYVGPIAAIIGVTVAAFAQFGTLSSTFAVALTSSLIAFVEGYVITPHVTGRAGRMNAVAIFVGILVWGWLWGVAGMLLAVPILTAIKAACTRIESLQPVAELLGE